MASADDLAMLTKYDRKEPKPKDYKPGEISATGRMNIKGSVLADDGTITLDMAKGSIWTGHSDAYNGGQVNVAMDESTWNVTGDSNLTKFLGRRSKRLDYWQIR